MLKFVEVTENEDMTAKQDAPRPLALCILLTLCQYFGPLCVKPSYNGTD